MLEHPLVALSVLAGLLAGCGESGPPASAAAGSGSAKGPAAQAPAAAPAASGGPTELTIAAAASLRELLEGTQAAFAAAHGGAKLQISFDASSTLSRQIEQGAPFDVLLSADADSVDRLAASVKADTRRVFMSNRLALVGRSDLPAPAPGSPADLVGTRLTIAMAGPAVPAGKYTRAYLTQHALLAELEPRVVTADTVKAALALVEAGTADCGFVYVTDAHAAKNAQLLWTAPPEDDPGIAYVAVQVAASQAPLAPEFLDWLLGAEFQKAAQELGFLPPNP
jgi:molybdate transport system substrate-binding protein